MILALRERPGESSTNLGFAGTSCKIGHSLR
jgi:hypothetical protein